MKLAVDGVEYYAKPSATDDPCHGCIASRGEDGDIPQLCTDIFNHNGNHCRSFGPDSHDVIWLTLKDWTEWRLTK